MEALDTLFDIWWERYFTGEGTQWTLDQQDIKDVFLAGAEAAAAKLIEEIKNAG